MTDDDWLCAYLLRFGTATIETAKVQEGETEFLSDMSTELRTQGRTQNAWWVITAAWRRRQGRPID